jgi:hypothetical protein
MKHHAHRAAAILAITLGVGLLAFPFVFQLWDKTPAAERTFDRFHFLVSDEGLKGAAHLYDVAEAGGVELTDKLAPALADQLNMSPGQFERYLERHYPAVANGVKEMPGFLQVTEPVVRNLARTQSDYKSAESIPGLGLPMTAVSWLAIALGAALLTAGTVALLRPGRWATIAILALGGALVLIPFALNLPEKTANAREVGDVAEAGLTAEGAQATRTNVNMLIGLIEQTRKDLIPGLAREFGVTEPALKAQFARDYPGFTDLLDEYEPLKPLTLRVVEAQEASVRDFERANSIPVKALPWVIVVPGLLLVIVAASVLVIDRRRENEPAETVVATAGNGMAVRVRVPAERAARNG